MCTMLVLCACALSQSNAASSPLLAPSQLVSSLHQENVDQSYLNKKNIVRQSNLGDVKLVGAAGASAASVTASALKAVSKLLATCGIGVFSAHQVE